MGRLAPRDFVPRLYVTPGLGSLMRAVYYRWGLMLAAQIVGFDAASRAARMGGRFLWKHIPLFRDEIRRTIAAAFDTTPDDLRVEAIARAHATDLWRYHLETEFIHRLIRPGSWRRFVRCVGTERLIDAIRRGRGVVGAGVYLGSHQAGMTALGCLLGGRVAGIVSPMQYSTQRRWMAGMVRRRLAKLYPRGDAIGNSLRALREGRLLLVIAEHKAGGKTGVETEFLGQRLRVPTSVAMLAWRTRCPIAVLTCTRREQPFTFEIRLHDWMEPPARGHRAWLADTTLRVTRSLEAAIREHPEQYAWVHRHLVAGRDRAAT